MIRTFRHSPAIVISILEGPITRVLVGEALKEFIKLAGARAWVFDAMKVADAPTPAVLDQLTGALTDASRSYGLRKVVVITDQPLVKVGASMVGMRAGVTCSIAGSMDEAVRSAA